MDVLSYVMNKNYTDELKYKVVKHLVSTQEPQKPIGHTRQVSGYGVASIPSNAKGQISVTLKGRTVNNLMGTDGDCEDTSKFTAMNCTLALDTTNKVFGNNGIKITIATGQTQGIMSYNIFSKLNKAKYYLITAYLKKGNCTDIRLRLETDDMDIESSAVTATSFTRVGIVVQPSDIDTATSAVIQIIVNGAEGQYGYVDGIMVNEITAEEYALGAAVCMSRYNYHNSTKSTISASRLKSVGKNLFDESKLESVNSRPTLVWDGKVLSLYGYSNELYYDHPFVKYVRSLLKVGHTYTSTRTVERLSGDFGAFGAVRFYNNTYGSFEIFAQGDGDRKMTFTVPEDFFEKWGTSTLIIYGTSSGTGERVRISRFQIEESSTATPYEPYKESIAYINGAGELRSLPNGIKDEICVTEGKHIQRVGVKTNVASGTVINYSDMATGGQFVAYAADGTMQVGAKGDTLTITAVMLLYQLATPIVSKVDVVGDLVAYPNGHIFTEPCMWGFMTEPKKVVTTPDLPIQEVRKVIRYDISENGKLIETDVTADVTAGDNNTSLTIANFERCKVYFYDCSFAQELTTQAEIVADVEVDNGVVTHDYGASAADWVLDSNESKATMLVCTNAGGAAKIIAPATEGKMYIVKNNSGQTITIKTASSTGVMVANGKTATVVYYDTDFIKLSEV